MAKCEDELDAISQKTGYSDQEREDKSYSRKRKKVNSEIIKPDSKRIRDKQEKYNKAEAGETKETGGNITVRSQVNGKDTGEKAYKRSDLYEWNSPREEYLVTIVLSQSRTTPTKNNLIRIYKIIVDSKIKFQGLKMVGFNRAEVSYRNRNEANDMIVRSRLKLADYSAYIPNRWRYRKGVMNEWVSVSEKGTRKLPRVYSGRRQIV